MRPGSSADARRRTGVVVALILGASFPAAAIHGAGAKLDPSGAYAIRWWTIEDGLDSMPLMGVAVAGDDAVWCVSRSTIMRFDGRRFVALPEPVTAALRGPTPRAARARRPTICLPIARLPQLEHSY